MSRRRSGWSTKTDSPWVRPRRSLLVGNTGGNIQGLLSLAATVTKPEAGSLPEGKARIRLEHDGTVLDVDEDDVEKVSELAALASAGWLTLPVRLRPGQPAVLRPLRGPGLAALPERVQRAAQPEAALRRQPDLHARRPQHGGAQPRQHALHVLREGEAAPVWRVRPPPPPLPLIL